MGDGEIGDGVEDGDIADGVEDGDITVAIGRSLVEFALSLLVGERVFCLPSESRRKAPLHQTIEGAICASKLPKENCRTGSPVLRDNAGGKTT